MARANKRIRLGDTVKVLTGNHRGSTGKVVAINAKKGRVTVEGINVVKRHQRGDRVGTGEIVEKEAPIHMSNVMVVDEDGNGTRIGVETDEQGRRHRVGKRNGQRL